MASDQDSQAGEENVPRAIVPARPREKRHLPDLEGVQEAAGITLTPTTSCSLPGVLGIPCQSC